MVKSKADSRIYFQFPSKISRHRLTIGMRVIPVSADLIHRTKYEGNLCRMLVGTSSIICPEIPKYNFPLRKSYVLNCNCPFSDQLAKYQSGGSGFHSQATRRQSLAPATAQNVLDLKLDEPVRLLIQEMDGSWSVNHEIRLRESKRQRGLVSLELQKPVRAILLIRTDGRHPDSTIMNIKDELTAFQRQKPIKMTTSRRKEDPAEQSIFVFHENEEDLFVKDFTVGNDAFENTIDEESPSFMVREGQIIWLNLKGNIKLKRPKDAEEWINVRYKRHKISQKRMTLSYKNQYGNHTSSAYRGTFTAMISSRKSGIEKLASGADCVSIPTQVEKSFVISRKIDEERCLLEKLDQILVEIPVTLPKVTIPKIVLRRPKLIRRLSVVEAEERKPSDPATNLAKHLSEYETKRFGETLGLQRGGMGIMSKLEKPERIRSMICSWRRAEPIMTDTRSHLASRLEEIHRPDLKRFVLKNSPVLPPVAPSS